MKEFKEICLEKPEWAERRFQMVKDLCAATVIKDGLTEIRGAHADAIISIAETILSKLYHGEDLLPVEIQKEIFSVLENTEVLNGSEFVEFNYDRDFRGLLQEAAWIEIEQARLDKTSHARSYCFLEEKLLRSSGSLTESYAAFLIIPSDRDEDLISDVKAFMSDLPNHPAFCILRKKGRYSMDAALICLGKGSPLCASTQE